MRFCTGAEGDGLCEPAVLIFSGGEDRNCNACIIQLPARSSHSVGAARCSISSTTIRKTSTSRKVEKLDLAVSILKLLISGLVSESRGAHIFEILTE